MSLFLSQALPSRVLLWSLGLVYALLSTRPWGPARFPFLTDLPRLAKRHRSESVSSEEDGKSAPDLSLVDSPGPRSDDSECHFPTLIPDDEVEESKSEVVAVVAVTRRERALLMNTFRREQRLARRAYLLHLQITFDSEIAEGRASREDLVLFPTEGECIAEAWENYLFEHIMQFDEDQAHLLVSFRSSLEVEPQHPDDYDRVLSLARTTALWNGLRRVYFGEQEVVSPPAPDMAGPGRDHAHDQVMMALQSEITTLEQRAAAAR